MGRRLIYVVLFVFLLSEFQYGQDVSFSQAYVSSSYLNPALTGLFNGFVRVSTQYREQGRGVLDNKFQTYAISSDIKYKFNTFNKFSEDILAVGLYFINDRVEVYDFNTNNIAISLAFHKALDYRTQQYIGGGFQMGIIQKNINREHLTFGDMYDNIDSYSFPTQEPIISNNFAVSDFSLGVYYTMSPTSKTKFGAGVAYQHFASPNLSFFRKNKFIENESSLFSKITFHTSFDYKYASFTTIQPRIRLIKQGPFIDLEVGSNFRISSFDWDIAALHIGLSGHVIKDLDSYGVGSLVPFVGFQYKNFMMGLSYDLSMTHVINTRNNLHTIEISFSYLGEQTNEGLVCPEF